MPKKSYKGRRFEIELASHLSLWWTGGRRDDVFWHTHDSGGRATRRGRQGKGTRGLHGDICATDPVGAPLLEWVTIECKKGYNRHTIVDLLEAPMPLRWDRGSNFRCPEQVYSCWLHQAEDAARQARTPGWLLVVKRDRRDPIVFFNDRVFPLINWDGFPHLYWKRDRSQVCGMRLDDWLEAVDPKKVMARTKR